MKMTLLEDEAMQRIETERAFKLILFGLILYIIILKKYCLVCCIYKTNECGTTISKNISYIQNPDFPSTYSTTGTRSYKISKMDSSICQVRLDFDTLVLGGNDETGAHAGCCGSTCGGTPGDHAADSLTVNGKTGWNPPSICHTNTGYHSKASINIFKSN